MKRTPLLVTLTLAIAVTAGCATLDAKQREWIFQPSDRSWGGAQSTADMQDVWIDFQSDASGKTERLHGLWLAHERADAPVLLYLHGARWNVAVAGDSRGPTVSGETVLFSAGATLFATAAPLEAPEASPKSA